MSKFISEHPIFSIFFTSCLTIILLIVITISGTIYIGSKTIDFLSEESASIYSEKNTEYKTIYGDASQSNKFLAIYITGIILNEHMQAEDPFGFLYPAYTYGFDIKNDLVKASKDPSIKGVILLINSPGGTITGSQAIADGVKYYADITSKPVIAHIEGLGASGAYLAASPANEIYTEPGSLTGSIGVIMGPFKHYKSVIAEGGIIDGVTTDNGIDTYFIYSGRNKDLFNPYKEMPEEVREVIQTGLDNEYNNFVNQVSLNRNIEKVVIEEKIGALIYDNKQALDYKLIDGTLPRNQTYNRLAELAGIGQDSYQIVIKKGPDFWSNIFKLTLNESTQKPARDCTFCNQMLYIYGNPETY